MEIARFTRKTRDDCFGKPGAKYLRVAGGRRAPSAGCLSCHRLHATLSSLPTSSDRGSIPETATEVSDGSGGSTCQYRSEERRVGKECRLRWGGSHCSGK